MKVKDLFLTQQEFDLVKNKEFGFLETTPQPQNLFPYYESDDYISHTDSKKNWFEKIYQTVKTFNIRYKFKKINAFKNQIELLDYGCGSGDFLEYSQKRGFNVFGIEPNEKARENTSKKIGAEFVSSNSLGQISKTFDIITLWHVLEHIPDLEEFIPILKSKLNPDGKIYIAVPNFESFDAKFYKSYWAAYDVPRHLWHFSPKTIQPYFNSFGMKIEKCYPLWFDSYYVSVLSEKYKKNPVGIIRGFLIGTISNFLALFSGNPSSVIYQITKEK